MKITITHTVIEIDFPDQAEDTVSKPSPEKPFSFRKQHAAGLPPSSGSGDSRQQSSKNNLLQLLENQFNGYFLTQ
jgi:hypothetical protein